MEFYTQKKEMYILYMLSTINWNNAVENLNLKLLRKFVSANSYARIFPTKRLPNLSATSMHGISTTIVYYIYIYLYVRIILLWKKVFFRSENPFALPSITFQVNLRLWICVRLSRLFRTSFVTLCSYFAYFFEFPNWLFHHLL